MIKRDDQNEKLNALLNQFRDSESRGSLIWNMYQIIERELPVQKMPSKKVLDDIYGQLGNGMDKDEFLQGVCDNTKHLLKKSEEMTEEDFQEYIMRSLLVAWQNGCYVNAMRYMLETYMGGDFEDCVIVLAAARFMEAVNL